MVQPTAVLLRIPGFRHQSLLRGPDRLQGQPVLGQQRVPKQPAVCRSEPGAQGGEHWLEQDQRRHPAVQVHRLRSGLYDYRAG